MRTRIVIGLSFALGAVLPTWIADAEGTVSTYLHDGWEIKAASQISRYWPYANCFAKKAI